MGVASTMIGNSVTIICFTLMAIHFENPWLVLLAIFFYRNYISSQTTIKGKEAKDEHDE